MRKLSLAVLAFSLIAGPASAFEGPPPAVTAAAKVHLAHLLSNEDYPAAARTAREQGLVEFSLDVGPNGRVMGCTVTRSSGSALLDSTTCRLIRSRARFTPAVDSAGATVSDTVAGRIVWRL